MKSYHITVLPGDGIGPEVISQAVKVLEICAEIHEFNLNFNYQLIGAAAIVDSGEPITQKTLESCGKSDAVLLGAIGDPAYDNNPDSKVRPEQGLLKLRKYLNLFANIRPITTYDKLIDQSPLKLEIVKDTDIVIYRELTGGIYFGEKKKYENSASDACVYSTEEIKRISHLAFQSAQKRNKKICLVDKANVLETSRLWRKVVQNLAGEYSDVQIDYLYVDNAAMQLIINPRQFDVILTENMFGDILSDLASVIPGSIGLLPSASTGTKTALFEPCHGSYPQAKSLDKANPMATILSAAMMLDYLGENAAAESIRSAVNWCVSEELTTEDINSENPLSCSMVGDMIELFIAKKGNIDFNVKTINRDTFYI